MSFSLSGKNEIKIGRIINDEKKVIDKPIVIIQPKSITGLISEKINDKKATIVVNEVYRHGRNISFIVLLILKLLLTRALRLVLRN